MTGRSAGLVRGWVDLYTRGLPAELRDRRRDEIAGDLWSQFEEAALIGRSPRATANEILVRLLTGIPADLTWRFAHRGGTPVDAPATPVGAGLPRAVGLGLTTLVAGAGLALLFVLFVITTNLVAPANPYYTSGAGVWLVLVGSASELVLAAALFGFAMQYGERLHRLVVPIVAIGGLLAALSAIGAYKLIAFVPVSTALLAWNLARLRVIGSALAALHVVFAAIFVGIILTVMQVTPGSGSEYANFMLVLAAWPLTLAAIGLAVMRADHAPAPAPAA